MPANKNWPRWIYASVSDHFKVAADASALPIIIEGIEDRTSEKLRLPLRSEFRLNGPVTSEVSKNYFRLYVDVNLLVQQHMDNDNAYKLMDAIGVFYNAMTTIDIYRHGNGPDDDGSFLGCLVLRDELSEPITIDHFGQLKEDTRLRESMIMGRYKMFLSN